MAETVTEGSFDIVSDHIVGVFWLLNDDCNNHHHGWHGYHLLL